MLALIPLGKDYTFSSLNFYQGWSPKRVSQQDADDENVSENDSNGAQPQQPDHQTAIEPPLHRCRTSSQQDTGTSNGDQLRILQEISTLDSHHQPNNQEEQQASIERSPMLTATDYKNAGNKLCSLHRYDDAIAYYNKAIAENTEVAIFYSNRALCHLKLQHWSLAVQDCRRALELDPCLIKAHFFLGQALAETGQYDEALKHLQRAHELAKENKMNFGDDIAYQIRSIKRRRWSKVEEDAAKLEDELYSYILNLIKKDRETQLRECGPTASSSSSPEDELATGDRETNIDKEATIISRCDNYIEKLETMFNNLKLQRKSRDVPDYMCGKISFEIMRDPVITPSGITYDRADIEEHLKRVGHFDPITRQPLKSSQLISNLAMKEVVDAYLSENEWAMYY